MIDHILGRPSGSWKRFQVFFVVIFWFWRILYGNPDGPRILWLRKANRLLKRYTPWQLIVSTLTGVYTVRNLDKILGLGAPEPLANLYSASYYRATWITTGLDAGFATAMTIRPKWFRDICSVLFSLYYIVYANEADEKLRKFRAIPTVEMLRTTWEKTTNPYLRALTIFPRISIRRKFLLPRPKDSTYNRPITVWLFFAPPEHHLARATDLILDFPGGGFISMTPEHHEERLRMWAVQTGKPVLAIEYGKAPEYPYPFSIDECFDAYRVLVESAGKVIGMSGTKLNVVLSGDSAGAHIAANIILRILETQLGLPKPVAIVMNYACLDFNFTSWMSPENLRVLQSEQSSANIPGLAEQKDHFGHISPLSMVGDFKMIRRRRSWRDTLKNLTSPTPDHPLSRSRNTSEVEDSGVKGDQQTDDAGSMADEEDETELREEERPLQARVRFHPVVRMDTSSSVHEKVRSATEMPLGTRLTMTSRTGYFQDRIISPSMMRAMAILYIGPHRNPDFASDYHLSPILAPSERLAQFPPILMSCGEKDPFVDDTVIFAGRVREAKRQRLRELEIKLAVQNGGHGEHLRMSASHVPEDIRSMKRERDELASQTDENWVRMQIYSDWSHGYLQMPMLMPEARTAIYELADWIDEAFAGKVGRKSHKRREPSTAARVPRRQAPLPVASEDSTPFVTETEGETDDVLTFSPKKRSPPSSFSSNSKVLQESPTSSENTIGSQNPRRRSPPRGDARHNVANGTASHSNATAPGINGANGVNSNLQNSAVPASSSSHSIISPPQRNGTPVKAGQVISESELMRRRRLLDSHLLPSGDRNNGSAK